MSSRAWGVFACSVVFAASVVLFVNADQRRQRARLRGELRKSTDATHLQANADEHDRQRALEFELRAQARASSRVLE